jgi:hypothetical protein
MIYVSIPRWLGWFLCIVQSLLCSVGLLFLIFGDTSRGIRDPLLYMVALVAVGGYLTYLCSVMVSYWRNPPARSRSLPWYRARDYKGDVTEEEKRELDSFRHRESEGGEHPSASYGDLPKEVQLYISKIEIEARPGHTSWHQAAVSICGVMSAAGGS